MEIEYDRDTDEFYRKCLDSGQLPRNDALKQIVLERVVEDLEVGKTYTKEELRPVLDGTFDDEVLVRRELVNFGYLRYDNVENTYRVHKRELSEEDYRNNTRLERHARDLGLLE